METTNCIFCGRYEESIFIEENGYTGRRCDNCNLIYISPRPAFDEVLDIYGHDNAFVTVQAHIADEYLKRLYARHSLSILKKHISGGSLLEIGAGAGYFLDEARYHGFSGYGIELNPTQAEYIRNRLNIPCETTPLSRESFLGKKFDVVYFCDVLSHFYHPLLEFEQIHAKLTDGGICCFETGNFADVDPDRLAAISTFQYPDHLYFFGEVSIKRILELTGFELISMHNYSIWGERFVSYKFNSLLSWLAKWSKVVAGRSAVRRNSTLPLTSATEPTDPRSKSGNSIKSQLKSLLFGTRDFLVYFGRYKIGAVLPKRGRPQTVIVMARKTRKLPIERNEIDQPA